MKAPAAQESMDQMALLMELRESRMEAQQENATCASHHMQMVPAHA